MKKNLVIGAITNYAWEDVEPFFNSFKQANFENTDCVMFVHNMTSRTLNKIKNYNVKIIEIPKKFSNCRVNAYRWQLYRDFLEDKRDFYNLIFALDVRDSFFQRDLFKLCDNKPFLGVALEDGFLTERWSTGWLLKIYGSEIYETIKNNRIICSGTICATYDEFIKFLDALNNEIKPFEKENFWVSDQNCESGIIYHKKMFHDVLKTSTNYDGYIMTIGFTNPENIKLDANGNIFNEVGEIAAVVHQYDRKKLIVAMVKAKYCAEKNFYSNLIYRCEKKFNVLRRDGILKIIIRKCKKLFKRI